jgi:dTDP-4-dehydrorhamnose reductase
MRILMFGRSGQVATEVQRRCPPGWTIDALGRDTADLTRPDACAEIIAGCEADAILNAAAYTAVDRAEDDEAVATVINGAAPAAMARAAAARALPFVHLSTEYVFDGSGTRGWAPEDPVAPLNAYGRSKATGERGVLAAGGPGAAVIRTSSVFSATGSNFVRTMLRLTATRDRLRIVADQVSGPTPAAAIADMLFTLLPHLGRDREAPFVAHYAGAPDISWAGFAREVFRQAGRAVEIEEIPAAAYPAAARRPLNSRLDCSLLAARYGIARPDWRVGLAEVLHALGASPVTGAGRRPV